MSFLTYNFRQCRICLESGENYKLMPIFDTGSDMARKIYLVTGVQVSSSLNRMNVTYNNVVSQIVEMKNYNVPAFICLRCLKCLGKAWNFRMAATTAEQHFKKKTFALETSYWKPHHTSVQPIPSDDSLFMTGNGNGDDIRSLVIAKPEEEFTFTIKTEPEDFVFEPLASAVSQNLEMLMDCPDGAVFKFEGKAEEEDVLQENSEHQNAKIPKSSKIWQCEICSKVSKYKIWATARHNIFICRFLPQNIVISIT
jgi:Zinc-finger associated domain (zf-AD)